MLPRSVPRVRVLLPAIAAVAAVAALGTVRSDLLLSRGFGKALANSRPGLSFTPVSASGQPTVGDEGYWLSRSDIENPNLLGKPFAVGDRITISGQDGQERKLQVIDMKAIGGDPILRTGTSAVPLRLLLVTCKVMDGGGEATVRFIVEAEPTPAPAPAPSKAL
jgi:hypothetical protein